MTTLAIESASIEPVDVILRTVADPTVLPPAFQVTAIGATTPTGAWVDGAWDGTWNPTTTRVSAITPTIGASGAGIAAAEGRYTLWVKWGSVVKRVATVVVT